MSNWFQKLGFGLKKTSTRLTSGITDIFIKRKVDSQTLEELEDLLITSDLGVKAAQKIISSFASRRLNKDADEQEIKTELANDIETILNPCEQPFLITNEKPYVILMVGVNGAGKTTTIGKLAAKLKDKHQISLIAADTFRAAAVEQLEIWGQRNNIRVYKGSNGCDAAALCFDGLKEALKQDDDIVFIDTAGRLQNKTGLMDELKKIVKVIKKIIPDAPHATLLTIDATTGQNALNQVKTFKEMVDVSGLIVTKLDGTAKGGIIVAVAEETGIPIHYIGIGEGIDDLDEFNARDFARNLLEIK
ncbi:MAG: signal recognition particle-docking protein FtsY [Azospirillum sp. 47_25]|jgi:signal recognition particle-docking protein ftsY|nr:MAG: signal recognition particle-docking protein FtsY [Azospirillum sp. 47_25]